MTKSGSAVARGGGGGHLVDRQSILCHDFGGGYVTIHTHKHTHTQVHKHQLRPKSYT